MLEPVRNALKETSPKGPNFMDHMEAVAKAVDSGMSFEDIAFDIERDVRTAQNYNRVGRLHNDVKSLITLHKSYLNSTIVQKLVTSKSLKTREAQMEHLASHIRRKGGVVVLPKQRHLSVASGESTKIHKKSTPRKDVDSEHKQPQKKSTKSTILVMALLALFQGVVVKFHMDFLLGLGMASGWSLVLAIIPELAMDIFIYIAFSKDINPILRCVSGAFGLIVFLGTILLSVESVENPMEKDVNKVSRIEDKIKDLKGELEILRNDRKREIDSSESTKDANAIALKAFEKSINTNKWAGGHIAKISNKNMKIDEEAQNLINKIDKKIEEKKAEINTMEKNLDNFSISGLSDARKAFISLLQISYRIISNLVAIVLIIFLKLQRPCYRP